MRIGRWACLLFLLVAFIDKPLSHAEGKNYAHTLREAKTLVAQKNYAKAVKMLTRAAEESAFSTGVHTGGIWGTIGDAYRGLGDFDRALDAYSKETQNQYQATKGKGIVYANTGKYELALSYLQDALSYRGP